LPYACVGKLAQHERVALLGLTPVGGVQASGRRDVRVPQQPCHSTLVGAGGADQVGGERAAEVVRDEIEAKLGLDLLERSASVSVRLSRRRTSLTVISCTRIAPSTATMRATMPSSYSYVRAATLPADREPVAAESDLGPGCSSPLTKRG
jgi:hypothetical protein